MCDINNDNFTYSIIDGEMIVTGNRWCDVCNNTVTIKNGDCVICGSDLYTPQDIIDWEIIKSLNGLPNDLV